MTDPSYTCEDWGTEKEWTKLSVRVPLGELDRLTAVMSMISNYLQIEDYSDIDLKTCYGDLIDEKILSADKEHATVSVYLPKDGGLHDATSFLSEKIVSESLHAEVDISGVREEDWANAWRAYYKPLHIGRRMVIVPAWEKYEPKENELTVSMDPGMAFGTGSHETTRLVIGMLEDYTKPGCRMLDVGTGSGILAICAAKLGAGICRAYDIDPTAVRVARENVRDAGLEKTVSVDTSDLLRGVDVSDGGYELVCANIVADIILRMAPDLPRVMKDGGVILVSGIISSRADDVKEGLAAEGLTLVEERTENDWYAMAFRK